MLEIDVSVDIAVYVLHSSVFEDIHLGRTPHHLNGEPFWQRKHSRVLLLKSQIFNSLDKRVGFRIFSGCSGIGTGRDGKGPF